MHRGSFSQSSPACRQTVQHKDGGVITALHVREGQHVKAGEILVELAARDLKAMQSEALTSDYPQTLLAQRARLLAERAGRDNFTIRRRNSQR